MSDILIIFIQYFFPIIMVGIILFDFFTMIIPNWLNLLLFAGFLVLAFMVSLPIADFGWYILAAFLTLLVGFGAFAANLFGGGDAKSVAAIAAWFGWSTDTLFFLLLTALLGGVFALLLLIIRFIGIGEWFPEKIRNIKWVKAIVTPEMRMPYGVAIGAAGLIIYSPAKWLL